MSAQFAKDRVSFVTPTSYSAAVPSVYAAATGGPLPAPVRAVATWFAGLMQRRAVHQELSLLSDRELADVGLSRADIPYVFDRGFVASRDTATA